MGKSSKVDSKPKKESKKSKDKRDKGDKLKTKKDKKSKKEDVVAVPVVPEIVPEVVVPELKRHLPKNRANKPEDKVKFTIDFTNGVFDAANAEWSTQLAELKRLSVGQFRGTVRVDMRSQYKLATTGELKPTQKGISLTLDEFKAIQDFDLDAVIKKHFP